MPSVERQLQLLKRLPGVSAVRGNLSRLGSDPSRPCSPCGWNRARSAGRGSSRPATTAPTARGCPAARHACEGGPGHPRRHPAPLRGTRRGNRRQPGGGDHLAQLHPPAGDQWNFTGAFGYSRRNLIELPSPAMASARCSTRGWVSWSGCPRNPQPALEPVCRLQRQPQQHLPRRPGPARSGAGVGARAPLRLSEPGDERQRLRRPGGLGGNVYLLQGISAVTPEAQRKELAAADIVPGEATALGGSPRARGPSPPAGS